MLRGILSLLVISLCLASAQGFGQDKIRLIQMLDQSGISLKGKVVLVSRKPGDIDEYYTDEDGPIIRIINCNETHELQAYAEVRGETGSQSFRCRSLEGRDDRVFKLILDRNHEEDIRNLFRSSSVAVRLGVMDLVPTRFGAQSDYGNIIEAVFVILARIEAEAQSRQSARTHNRIRPGRPCDLTTEQLKPTIRGNVYFIEGLQDRIISRNVVDQGILESEPSASIPTVNAGVGHSSSSNCPSMDNKSKETKRMKCKMAVEEILKEILKQAREETRNLKKTSVTKEILFEQIVGRFDALVRNFPAGSYKGSCE